MIIKLKNFKLSERTSYENKIQYQATKYEHFGIKLTNCGNFVFETLQMLRIFLNISGLVNKSVSG